MSQQHARHHTCPHLLRDDEAALLHAVGVPLRQRGRRRQLGGGCLDKPRLQKRADDAVACHAQVQQHLRHGPDMPTPCMRCNMAAPSLNASTHCNPYARLGGHTLCDTALPRTMGSPQRVRRRCIVSSSASSALRAKGLAASAAMADARSAASTRCFRPPPHSSCASLSYCTAEQVQHSAADGTP